MSIRFDGAEYDIADEDKLREVLRAIEDARKGEGRVVGLQQKDGTFAHLLLTAQAPIAIVTDGRIDFGAL